MKLATAAGIAVALFVWSAGERAALAQRYLDPRLERAMLQEAAGHSSQGRHEAAEATLRELLRLRPRASSAIFALESLFRKSDRLPEVLPLARDFTDRNPRAQSIWELRLKVLAELGRKTELIGAATLWSSERPDSDDPYLRGAEGLAGMEGGAQDALSLLEEGAERPGAGPELLATLAQARAQSGDAGGAGRALARALGQGASGDLAAMRMVEELGPNRNSVIGAALSELSREATDRQLESMATLALRVGNSEEAGRLARMRVDRGAALRPFLRAFAARAEEQGADQLALWALEERRGLARNKEEERDADARIVEVAIGAGDSLLAIRAATRIRDSWPPASRERQSAWRRELELVIAAAPVAAAREGLNAFRTAYPHDESLAEMAAEMAGRLLREGSRDEAARMLEEIKGPSAFRERAYLMLESGAIQGATELLAESVPDLSPEAATETLALLLLLRRLSPESQAVAAAAAVLDHRGAGKGALREIYKGMERASPQDLPPLLAYGARLADGSGDEALAIELRRRIVGEHSGSAERAEAALLLARALAKRPGGTDESIRLLESMIVDLPDSPLAPSARQELSKLRGRSG